jgi:NitT/TauT family transport system substrate-binding protein
MQISRRDGLKLASSAALAGMMPGRAQAQPTLQKLRYGFLDKAVSPDILNLVIPEQLGFYREEGISIEAIPLGSSPAVLASIAQGRIDFGLGVPSFLVPVVAGGQSLPIVNFFEHTYPFKWDMAVVPDSPFRVIGDLKGKRIGVSSLAQSTYPVGRAILALQGIDPDKDVSWLAVGEGVAAGLALTHNQIDGLFYFDTGFGTIDEAGLKLRLLPRPEKVPDVGGLYLAAAPAFLRDHRAWAVGFGRGVAKAAVFTRANPQAAAYAFIQMYPEAAPRGKSVEEQVHAILGSLSRRLKLYASYNPAVTQWGYIDPAEWVEEVKFAHAEQKIPDPSIFYTDDLIADINRFDAAAVKAQALAYKLPFQKSG